jgi:hypothetical protein
MLARFDIVLVAFPFTDGPNVEPRPAIVRCDGPAERRGSSRKHGHGLGVESPTGAGPLRDVPQKIPLACSDGHA